MRDEAIEFGERSLVEQQVEALPCRELALLVLRREAVGAAAEFGLGAALLELVQFFAHAHRVRASG